ncbi:beta-ketoacyl synthase chain length factor [Xenorhabdus bovienii]|uniref:beta-ketoacyl synthase chain length factor n=1 Tax=Xenorhabdus bovienii TaxID=40576 RepID=UPI0004D981CD|nr:beta-ketoacyl synthase chain length factor [Xenorhabdus bovienii]CDG87369.1 Beta-ketoacyl synthase domain-containing protein [Xenorhabdus bovienii str. feltiae France]CDG90868.1 Beta-ketoacyl synthase domain-containing protein [Xenorhabdus bovienii str. feltiae Florida]
MKLTLDITDWQAIAPGLSTPEEWKDWSIGSPATIDGSRSLAKCTQLPMMTARRLSSGSRLAVDCGLSILRRNEVDAVVYTSRHGELERNYQILVNLAQEECVSPTNFAMSVHNSSVGNLTIVAKAPLVSSSISAGVDSFQQGLLEVLTLFHAGYGKVLLVDFDGYLPSFYHDVIGAKTPTYPFAVALLLQQGKSLHCEKQPSSNTEPGLPQSLQFLHGWLSHTQGFTVTGDHCQWQWNR